MNYITRCHVFCLMCAWQQRERNLTVKEALSKYQLQRLLHFERRGDANKVELRRPSNYSQQMEELQQCLAVMCTPLSSRAMKMQRLSEEREHATKLALDQQATELEKLREEISDICQALNDLSAHMNLKARCEDRRGRACAGVSKGGQGGGGLCTPQEVVKAVHDRVNDLLVQEVAGNCRGRHGDVMVTCDGANGKFDALTLALHRLEESRAECYALKQGVGRNGQEWAEASGRKGERVAAEVKPGDFPPSVAVSPSLLDAKSGDHLGTPPPPTLEASLMKGFSMESWGYEVHQAALQEHRCFLLMVKSLFGLRAILLPLSPQDASRTCPKRSLSLFAERGISLHQWVTNTDGKNKPTRYAVVFYPLAPHRRWEASHRNLEFLLITAAREKSGSMSVIDLRNSAEAAEAAALGVYLSGAAVRFSVDVRFMYVCCGAASAGEAARKAISHLVQRLCGELSMDSSSCFCYYCYHNHGCCGLSSYSSSSKDAAVSVSLGWVGAGICAWALDNMAFESPTERRRFMPHLHATYHTVLHLSCPEMRKFATDCAEVASRLPGPALVRRQLVISSRALQSLSKENRTALTSWYGGGGCIVPDLSIIESISDRSAGSMMIAVVTHGSSTPPPPKSGFLSFSGIAVAE